MSKSKDYSIPVSEAEITKAKKALTANGFKVEVLDTLDDVRKRVEGILPEGSEVFTGTSVTLTKAGLDKIINDSGKYVSVRNKFMALQGDPKKAVEMKRIGSAADYALGSVHAVTEDGQVVIASATGSQLPSYVYGASNVIWVVGTQKIVADLSEAFDRIENYTFQLEDKRALKAYGAHSSLNKLLIYRKETAGRVTIIFVKESVGF